ncbi:MAG TPA: thioredoxin [Methylomirabilota bacterium]
MRTTSGTFLIRCGACGTTNRVARDKVYAALEAICGRCRRPLTINGRPRTVTDATFAADVERSALPVLVDAWAPWCWPCQMIGPVVEDIALEMSDRLRVCKLNVDENPSTAARFAISSIPTLLLFARGREVDRIVGVQTKADIVRRLARVLRASSRAAS